MNKPPSSTKSPFLLCIAGKITMICVVVVVTFLATSNAIFLKLESKLVGSIINDNEISTDKTIEAEGEAQRLALSERIQATAKICSVVSYSFLYTIDSHNLVITLQPYMGLSEIQAIAVTDYVNTPFVALWRESGEIKIIVVLAIVVVLVMAIVLSLRAIAVKPIKRVTERLKDMAQGEGDLTVRLEGAKMIQLGEPLDNQ